MRINVSAIERKILDQFQKKKTRLLFVLDVTKNSV
jgi:transcriptional regulator